MDHWSWVSPEFPTSEKKVNGADTKGDITFCRGGGIDRNGRGVYRSKLVIPARVKRTT